MLTVALLLLAALVGMAAAAPAVTGCEAVHEKIEIAKSAPNVTEIEAIAKVCSPLCHTMLIMCCGLDVTDVCPESVSVCASSPCQFGGECSAGTSAKRPFVCSTFATQWDTTLTNEDSSASNQIYLPLMANGTYNFVVQWGDGKSQTITSSTQALHTYAKEGRYVIIITGTLVGWRFNDNGDQTKLLDVLQWGTMQLGNSGAYFYGAKSMVISAKDTPDLMHTTNLANMFNKAAKLDSPLASWDVSRVTNMDGLFAYASSFNQPLDAWDVSSVTSMNRMFQSAIAFNQPLGSWNVGQVTNMEGLFLDASSFNQPIGSWDMSSVTTTKYMFWEAASFNQPIGNWDMSSVTTLYAMFKDALAFNQPVDGWDVSKVMDMDKVFDSATSFNQPLDGWNTSTANTMSFMFHMAKSFNQPIGSWDVSHVFPMQNMFHGAAAFVQDISHWCVRRISSPPLFFSSDTSPLWLSSMKPQWGKCPTES
jgi:surface protein